MNPNAHKTAIKRNKLSAPNREAVEFEGGFNLAGTEWLDYGCGRGDDIRYLLALGVNVHPYDPHYFPDRDVLNQSYDVVTCNYVLNVIDDYNERRDVVSRVLSLTAPGGCAYFAVRTDVKTKGITKLGTWQANIPSAEIVEHVHAVLDGPVDVEVHQFRGFLLVRVQFS